MRSRHFRCTNANRCPRLCEKQNLFCKVVILLLQKFDKRDSLFLISVFQNTSRQVHYHASKAYGQTFTMELFAKMVKSSKLLTVLAESSIIDVLEGPKYVFEFYLLVHNHRQTILINFLPIYTPWKHQKIKYFLVLPGGIKQQRWPEIG